MNIKFEEYKNNVLKDPEVLAEYEVLQPEMEILDEMMDIRCDNNKTQKKK